MIPPSVPISRQRIPMPSAPAPVEDFDTLHATLRPRVVAFLHLKLSHSSWVSWNMKSAGNRSSFLLTAWTRDLVSTP